ncbi:MAG: hypothetical protein KAW09_03830 [Thermoplasmata archaeon]|nr:hypothetical protein [Thermoplasmata archaeon]
MDKKDKPEEEEETPCPDCGNPIEPGEDCLACEEVSTSKERPEDREAVAVGVANEAEDKPGVSVLRGAKPIVEAANALGLSKDQVESLTPPDDLAPELPGIIRNMTRYRSRYNNVDLPDDMMVLVRTYATEHCLIRFECQTKGLIGACLSCFCEKILLPDMIEKNGGKALAMWPAKR